MKTVDVEAAVATATAMPAIKPMTKAEKLKHWANIVRDHKGTMLLYDGIEHYQGPVLGSKYFDVGQMTAFAVALADPVLREQGLQSPASLKDIMGFFEVTQTELHMFSCNCGGPIDNIDQANRIERLGTLVPGSLVTRALGLFR